MSGQAWWVAAAMAAAGWSIAVAGGQEQRQAGGKEGEGALGLGVGMADPAPLQGGEREEGGVAGAVVPMACTVLTILLFLTPWSSVQHMRALQNTEGKPGTPYVCMMVNCFCWVVYGLLLLDPAVMITNGTGLFLSCYYVLSYYLVCKPAAAQAEHQRQLAIAGGLMAGCIGFIFFLSPNPRLHMGLISCAAAVVMFASPLGQLMTVIVTKSTATMSFPLSAMSCAVTLGWTGYGWMINDAFVMYPNAAGLFLACAQLSLFAIYASPSTHAQDVLL